MHRHVRLRLWYVLCCCVHVLFTVDIYISTCQYHCRVRHEGQLRAIVNTIVVRSLYDVTGRPQAHK